MGLAMGVSMPKKKVMLYANCSIVRLSGKAAFAKSYMKVSTIIGVQQTKKTMVMEANRIFVLRLLWLTSLC